MTAFPDGNRADRPIPVPGRHYTDRARRSLLLALQEARALGHSSVNVHHMLTGLALEGEGVAALALARLSLDAAVIRAAAAAATPPGTERARGLLPFTPRAAKAIEHAARESATLGHVFTGTEHLLLGLMREAESEASPCAAVLRALDTGPGDVREAVLGLLHGYTRAEPGAGAPPATVTGAAAEITRLLGSTPDGDLGAAFGALTPEKRAQLRHLLEGSGG